MAPTDLFLSYCHCGEGGDLLLVSRRGTSVLQLPQELWRWKQDEEGFTLESTHQEEHRSLLLIMGWVEGTLKFLQVQPGPPSTEAGCSKLNLTWAGPLVIQAPVGLLLG